MQIRAPPVAEEVIRGALVCSPYYCAVVAKSADATDLGSGGAPPSQGLRSVRVQLPSTAPAYMTRGCLSIRRLPLVCLIACTVRSESFILRPL